MQSQSFTLHKTELLADHQSVSETVNTPWNAFADLRAGLWWAQSTLKLTGTHLYRETPHDWRPQSRMNAKFTSPYKVFYQAWVIFSIKPTL